MMIRRVTLIFSYLTIILLVNPINQARGIELDWIYQLNLPGQDVVNSVTAFNEYIYVAGYINSSLPGYTNAGSADAFVQKYDSIGNIVWSKQFGTPGIDMVENMYVDSSGIYISGKAGGILANQNEGGPVFVRKYNTNGDEIWTIQFGTLENVLNTSAIAVDQSGIYISGELVGAFPSYVNSGGTDAYLIKFDHERNVIWTKQFGISDWNARKVSPTGICIGSTNVYLAGTLYGGGGTLPGETNYGGTADVFVRKYESSTGGEMWTRQFGTDRFDGLHRIACDETGIYIPGTTNGAMPGQNYIGDFDCFLRKYDYHGIESWTRVFGTPAYDSISSISLVPSGIYLAGRTKGAFPGQIYMGGYDIAAFKFDRSGDLLWNFQLGTVADEGGIIAVDGSNVFLSGATGGYLLDSANYGTSLDIYIAKLIDSTLNLQPIADAGEDQTVHSGSSVTLGGGASFDPDENYPLTYAWTMLSRPSGSSASLTNSDTLSPSFEADIPGDYTIQLVVKDSKGSESAPDEVLVSTYNSPPVADAGENQAVIIIGTNVTLGTDPGRRSYDPDGDNITYLWTMNSNPAGSTATLSDSTSATPTFVADIHGDYEIELVVSDPWISSDPDMVTVSFDNVKPVADAGENHSLVQGDTVYLDGSESHDTNLDALTYSWSIVSKPADSQAEFNDPSLVQTQFVADLPGEYVVSLVVNDSLVDSDASNITIVAITLQDASTQKLTEAQDKLNGLDDGTLKNKNLKNALTNKINAALAMIDEGRYHEALEKLENDILGKMNGCAESGAPDKNDWIVDCEAQGQIYPVIMEATQLLSSLI